jgi:hypothetical protein
MRPAAERNASHIALQVEATRFAIRAHFGVSSHTWNQMYGYKPADSDEGGHRFRFDRGHHSNLMAAR